MAGKLSKVKVGGDLEKGLGEASGLARGARGVRLGALTEIIRSGADMTPEEFDPLYKQFGALTDDVLEVGRLRLKDMLHPKYGAYNRKNIKLGEVADAAVSVALARIAMKGTRRTTERREITVDEAHGLAAEVRLLRGDLSALEEAERPLMERLTALRQKALTAPKESEYVEGGILDHARAHPPEGPLPEDLERAMPEILEGVVVEDTQEEPPDWGPDPDEVPDEAEGGPTKISQMDTAEKNALRDAKRAMKGLPPRRHRGESLEEHAAKLRAFEEGRNGR